MTGKFKKAASKSQLKRLSIMDPMGMAYAYDTMKSKLKEVQQKLILATIPCDSCDLGVESTPCTCMDHPADEAIRESLEIINTMLENK